MDDLALTGVFLVAILVGIPIYFIPFFVARNRGHKDVTAIGILNLFLGWTFLGWVIALVWAVKKD